MKTKLIESANTPKQITELKFPCIVQVVSNNFASFNTDEVYVLDLISSQLFFVVLVGDYPARIMKSATEIGWWIQKINEGDLRVVDHPITVEFTP